MDCLDKVRRHPSFMDRDPESLKGIAISLVDPKQIKARFEHLLEVEEYVQNITEGDLSEPAWSLERDKLRNQQKMDAAKAWSLPVKLFLSKLERPIPVAARPFTAFLRLEYGPLHAGLVVGDVCIDWNTSSLVVPELAPDISVDFQAHVDGGGSLEQHAGINVKAMSMANHKNMDTPHKLDIIYKSRAEKEKLIDNLVDVIAKYNKAKTYSLFFCNCQHFVKEAMDALHIKAPQFGGNLGDYLKGLKQGKLASLQFDSHEELDVYAQKKLKEEALDLHEKEYLLCVYFQFHTTEIQNQPPEEQEKWKCEIVTCQCGELEYQVRNRTLYLDEFRQRQASLTSPVAQPSQHISRHISVDPKVSSVLEEEDDDDDSEVVAGPSTLMVNELIGDDPKEREKQEKALRKWSGYSSRVRSKLKSHPKYQDMSEDKLDKIIEIFSEKEPFRFEYFSRYIDSTSAEVIIATCEEEAGAASLTDHERERRASDRFEMLSNLRLNLIIRAPSRRVSHSSAAKSPILFGLQVGDYVFEWNEHSLVTPVDFQEIQTEPVLLSPVLMESKWPEVVDEEKGRLKLSIEEAIQNRDYTMQVQLHYELADKKDKLLFAFIETVMEYNRNKTYNRKGCNNQTFIVDAMKSFGIKRPAKFSSTIEQHIKSLKPSKTLAQKKMSTHNELDATVTESESESLSRADIEFLIAKYFLFHVSSWEGEQGGERSSDRWECLPECKLPSLEKLLERRTSISSVSST